MAKRRHRSDRLLRVLKDYERIVVITHDTPDPDAIAAGWALLTLIRERLGKTGRLIGGGAILRAENVHMVRLLKPPVELLNEYTPEPDEAVVLVDCSPESANHLLGQGGVRPVGVIDHHKAAGRATPVKFRDVRSHAAAAATIVATYLREQKVEPSPALATALLYAVRTEVIGTHMRFSRTERGVLTWLGERIDHQALREIENAPLARDYFEDLGLAIGSTFLFDEVAVCFLQHSRNVEIVGEVADLLIRCNDVKRVLCGAITGTDLVFSARTTADGGDAVALLAPTLRGLGHWGGHPHRAGGKVVGDAAGRKSLPSLLEEIKGRWLKACGADTVRGTRLVSRREIMEIL